MADLSVLQLHFAMITRNLFLELDLSLGQLRSGKLLLLDLLLVVFLAVADVSVEVDAFCGQTIVLVFHTLVEDMTLLGQFLSKLTTLLLKARREVSICLLKTLIEVISLLLEPR